MNSGFEITCVNKNRMGMITRIGGNNWSFEIHEAIVKIVSNQLRFNIRVDGRYTEVGIRGDGSNAYLALEPDGFPLHNMAGLPSC